MSSVALQTSNVDLQYAALPWRRVHGEVQILLVTTKTTGRWIVPKGWPIPGRKPAECAAREALEEAGVVGEVAAQAVGSFSYQKRREIRRLAALQGRGVPDGSCAPTAKLAGERLTGDLLVFDRRSSGAGSGARLASSYREIRRAVFVGGWLNQKCTLQPEPTRPREM